MPKKQPRAAPIPTTTLMRKKGAVRRQLQEIDGTQHLTRASTHTYATPSRSRRCTRDCVLVRINVAHARSGCVCRMEKQNGSLCYRMEISTVEWKFEEFRIAVEGPYGLPYFFLSLLASKMLIQCRTALFREFFFSYNLTSHWTTSSHPLYPQLLTTVAQSLQLFVIKSVS